ncbi:conserved hypothetical protein [Microbacterium sp. 8M]|uniref:hypothetical protein n=1 Tax=Microbacterium sp. 8M TaxID=2653153 RepID=UPI0012EF73C4|nr:hypothetical protein [Microbacterium sp. 8M]VXA98734.1 conserved hypothetical protein [Microbacterium sp. 8M]
MTGYVAPTRDQVAAVLRRIPTPALRRAFFEGLRNPLWLAPLAREGAFAKPPSNDVGADDYWPEIDYVIRSSAAAPKTAVDILLTLSESRNSWIRRAVFAVGAQVPASEAARLKPLLKKWLATGFGWRTDPRDMASFTVNLLNGGERKAGEWVANVLFRPGSLGATAHEPILRDYWYASELPRVVTALGPESLPLVLGWLVQYENGTSQPDGWSLSRPSIGESSDSHQTVEDALIDASRDLSVQRLQAGTLDTVDVLLSVRIMLARRIAMYAVREAIVTSTTGTPQESSVVELGTRLLLDPSSMNEQCRIEYAQLAQAVAARSPSSLKSLKQTIDRGPDMSSTELRSRLARDGDVTDRELDTRVAEFLDHWKHAWLSAIGAESLPPQLRVALADLDAQYGMVERPLRPPIEVISWTGPSSPRTHDELGMMAPAELMSHLESWQDTGDGWGPKPSHEGQRRELTSLITSNPERIAGVHDLVTRLRPIYLRAILSGWEAASKAGLELDWHQVLTTTGDVLAHPIESDFPPQGGRFDDDPDFSGAKGAAIDLLEELVKPEAKIPPTGASNAAELLISAASDEAAWHDYASRAGESGMDPLTLSLNWQWPTIVRGLAALVCHGRTTAWSEASRSALRTELDRPDPWGASRAVIGEHLGRLLNADELWTEQNLTFLFGSAEGLDRNQQVALSTALAIHHYHRALYSLLAPSMVAALDSAEPVADGWPQPNSSPVQRIGEWAIKAIIFGDATPSDAVFRAFFSTTDPDTRGGALGHIGWEMMHATEVSESIRDEFARLWDERIDHVKLNTVDVAELRQFYWVIKSGKFCPEWWLPRLNTILAFGSNVDAERFMIGKELAAAADSDPHGAFHALTQLLSTTGARRMAAYELSRNAVPVVLARAIKAGDPQLETRATKLLNELGAAGDFGLAQRVEMAARGELSQADVEE